MLQLQRRSANIFPKSHQLWDVIYTFVFADTHHPTSPLQRTHIAFQFHSRHVTAVVLEYFAFVRRKKKKKNPIETSSRCHLCQGLQIHISGAAFIPPPILVEPFSLITLALLLLSRPLRSARCCYSKSALGYWFSFWTWTGPIGRPAHRDANSYRSFMNGGDRLPWNPPAHSVRGTLHLTVVFKVIVQ